MSAIGGPSKPRPSRDLVFAALLAVFTMIVSLIPLAVPVPAEAADARDWDAGQIISDSVFYNSDALTAGQTQDFLNARVSTCRATSMPCLKNYAQATDNRPADSYCNGYRGQSRETAAQIIDNVARSCGVSQKVLIVLLEKEQGLVTSPSPSDWAYSAATGQGCPDSAPCDASTAGFFYQVYYAARQFEIYRLNPTWWGYQAGRWNNILFNPDTGCGTQRVFIQNQATAGLYIYTPYVPNQAALSNLYGTGDRCSAYGNRNFWRIFTDWFGNPKIDVRARIDAKYVGLGGSGGWLGPPVADYMCGLSANGCYRTYERGRIYASENTPGVSVNPVIQKPWDVQGGTSGVFKYPRDEAFVVGGGWLQSFDGGIAVIPDGREAQFVAGPIGKAWFDLGGLTSPPGAPTSQMYCGLSAGGCVQIFANGWYYSSAATEAHWVTGPVLQAWSDRGSESGSFGYPVTDPQRDEVSRGEWARFQGGVLFVDAGKRVWTITGDAAAVYADESAMGRALGAPVSERNCSAGGCIQRFSNGLIAQADGAPARVLRGAIADAWLADGGFSSRAADPLAAATCGLAQGGCRQSFRNGDYAWTQTSGALLVPTSLLGAWSAAGGEEGAYGYPLAVPSPRTGGTVQSFQGGVGVVSSTGQAQFIAGPIGVAWLDAGAFTSPAQAPKGSLGCGLVQGGCLQPFEKGWYYWSPKSGAHLVPNALLNAWSAAGSERGPFGYPLAPPVALTGGTVQSFQGGVGVVASNGAAQFVAGPIGSAWLDQGAFTSKAGYPIAPQTCDSATTSCAQTFFGGTYSWTQAAGVKFQPR